MTTPTPTTEPKTWSRSDKLALLAVLLTLAALVTGGAWAGSISSKIAQDARDRETLQRHERELRNLDGVRTDLVEIRTDLKWVRERLTEKESRR
jgi:Tfp pilus assembly protein PilO